MELAIDEKIYCTTNRRRTYWFGKFDS